MSRAKNASECGIRIGISGWRYPPWRGQFYPEDLPQRLELQYASRQLPTIEINGTFYSLQKPEQFENWHDATPGGFVFSVKAPRFITHIRRLKEVQEPIANFLASGLFSLKTKLGPILWQLPPSLPFDGQRMRAFLQLLPPDTDRAAQLAKHRGERMKGRSVLTAAVPGLLRHAVEVRHQSFVCDEFMDMMREHGVAIVMADTAGKWPVIDKCTSDFAYARLHGDQKLYASGYTQAALLRWAKLFYGWSHSTHEKHGKQGTTCRARDVYCYFDNDTKVKAPGDARRLMQILKLPMQAIEGR